MSGPQKGPLAGVRVLELARILAGPWAGQTLADLGAEVIKVERPGAGDDTRGWGPPFMEDKDGGQLSSSYNLACNRGKRSIAVDFETPDGQRIVKKLAARSDVLIENFKFGGLAKYGLDYKSLSADNPRLIYCSITGFGQDGPYKTRAGYDLLVQGMGGIMDITGDPAGEPTRLGVAFADVFTGTYSALAITAALKEREHTGKGSHIDMALLDTMVGVLANQATYYLVSGKAPVRMGNAHASVVPYQTFPTTDGWMLIACGNDGQFVKMMQVLGDPAMAKDERYKTNAGARGQPRHADPAAVRTDQEALQGRACRKIRGGRRAGRPDQHAARGVQRSAGDRARHARRPAASRRQGRHDPGRAHADHHQRPPRRRRPRAAEGRRAYRRSAA